MREATWLRHAGHRSFGRGRRAHGHERSAVRSSSLTATLPSLLWLRSMDREGERHRVRCRDSTPTALIVGEMAGFHREGWTMSVGSAPIRRDLGRDRRVVLVRPRGNRQGTAHGASPRGVDARVVTSVKACLRWSGWEASWAFPQTRQQGQLWRGPSLAPVGFLARVDNGVLLASHLLCLVPCEPPVWSG